MISEIEQERDRMLAEIETEARLTQGYTGKAVFDPVIMQAMAKVPRHEFVSGPEKRLAYYNGPLPIGHGQTISQPYIVALMTDLLSIGPDSILLEIGTGSGYQTAILAEIASKVYSLEIIEPLAIQARQRLDGLGYKNIESKCGDGYEGWPEHAPYDGIIVTAAAPYIPPALIEQLKTGGRMVIPVASEHHYQEIILVEKKENGEFSTKPILPVSFVPLRKQQDIKLNTQVLP